MDTIRVRGQVKHEHNSLTDASVRFLYTFSMDIKKEIGQRIKMAREKNGWSLSELAARTTSLQKSRIGNYEQGTRTPGPLEAKELAHALGVSAAYILCVDEELPQPEDEKKLLEKYRGTDKRGKAAIHGVAESQSVYDDKDRKVKKG